jgi:hypothetical protein
MKKCLLFSVMTVILFQFIVGQDYEVAPVQLFFSAEPGESQVKVVNIKNHSSQQTSFILSLSDYDIDSKGGKKVLPANSSKYSIANWISISPSFFELEPNSERQITVSVQPPIDDNGSRWGMIYVRPAKEKTSFDAGKELSAGVFVSSRIVIDVYQTSRSNKNLKAKIDQLREIKSDDPEKRRFSAIVTNLSDIIIPCKVHLIASNLKTGKEHQFPHVQFQSYPKNTQKIILTMPNKLSKGKYAIAAVLDYGSSVTLEGTQMVIEVK